MDERVASIQQTWRWFWSQVGADGLLIPMVLMKVLMKLLITKVLMSNPGDTTSQVSGLFMLYERGRSCV